MNLDGDIIGRFDSLPFASFFFFFRRRHSMIPEGNVHKVSVHISPNLWERPIFRKQQHEKNEFASTGLLDGNVDDERVRADPTRTALVA